MSCSIMLASTLSCLATSAQIRLARQDRGGCEGPPGATGMELVDSVAAGSASRGIVEDSFAVRQLVMQRRCQVSCFACSLQGLPRNAGISNLQQTLNN